MPSPCSGASPTALLDSCPCDGPNPSASQAARDASVPPIWPDDTTNFMNNAADACLRHFSPCQVARMHAVLWTFRSAPRHSVPPSEAALAAWEAAMTQHVANVYSSRVQRAPPLPGTCTSETCTQFRLM